MKSLPQLETSTKLFACIALVLCVGAGESTWLIGHLTHLSELSARASMQANGAAAALARAEFALARSWSLGLLVLEFGVAIVLCIWLACVVARPVRAAVALARRIAEGDLSDQAGGPSIGKGGLLRAMQAMTGKLVATIVELRGGTESIAGDAGALSTASLDLSARTRCQNAALDATTASMQQLAGTVNEHAEQARQASQLALSASALTLKGGAVVAELAATLASIDAAVKRIARTINVFDAVACQSHLLLQNATLAAARADEQGGACALVAAQVRDLAQRSAGAAKEIDALIDDALAQLGAGALLADRAGSTMSEVAGGVQRVGECVGELVCASVDQGERLTQLKQEIAAIGQASRQNARLVGEATAATAALRAQADRLNRVAGGFVLDAEHSHPPHQLHLIARKQIKPAGAMADAALRGARVVPAVRVVGGQLAAQHGNGATADVNEEPG